MTQNCRLLPKLLGGVFCQAHHSAQRDLGSCSSKTSRAQEERWRKRGRAQWLPPNLPVRSPLRRGVWRGREGPRLINILSCGWSSLLQGSYHLCPKIPQKNFFGSLDPLGLPIMPVVNQKWDSIFNTPYSSHNSIRDLLGQAVWILPQKFLRWASTGH